MNGRRQRLAWAIVLAGLFACVGLVIFVPLGLNAYRQRAMRAMEIEVQANQGTVGIVQVDGESVALFAGDPAFSLGADSSVLTNATDTALLLARSVAEGPLIARVQVYGSTQVQLDDARSPRFESSSRKNELALDLRAGRILLSVPDEPVRPVTLQVRTPQGLALIEEQGQYSINATNSESQVTVLQGSLVLEAGDKQLELVSAQRATMSAPDVLEGPLTAERNLIANGEFSQGLEMWLPLSPNTEIADQPSVEVAADSSDPEPVVIFKRLGIGHADAGLRQVVGQDVTDFESLKLLMSMHVAEQSLGVCGQQGSECPVIVRIEYVDVNGTNQIWQQGFYASGEVGPDTPDVCVACPPPLNEHQRVPFDQLAFYESENLLEKLGQLGILPAQIKSITVIASGHSFESRIYDLALIAVE
ncbi:MAG: FecR domain-containing protein [Chloroflexota bacterium]|nr:MAG: FecR domain-containing protein [Chloroflexota bacterium]